MGLTFALLTPTSLNPLFIRMGGSCACRLLDFPSFPLGLQLPRAAHLTNSLIMDINSTLKLFNLLFFAGLLVREIKAYIRLSKFNGPRLAAFSRCQLEFEVIYCPNWRCQ